MSDNPTDSLRRELEAALDLSRLLNERTVNNIVDDLESVVSAALEAARADERERLQQENQELRAALQEANQANERLLMALDSGGV